MLRDVGTTKPFFVEHEESDHHIACTEPMNLQEVLSVDWIWHKKDIFIIWYTASCMRIEK